MSSISPEKTHLNPGSREAQESGCKCPVLDNGHGKGYMGQSGVYVWNLSCPLHFPVEDLEPEPKTCRTCIFFQPPWCQQWNQEATDDDGCDWHEENDNV